MRAIEAEHMLGTMSPPLRVWKSFGMRGTGTMQVRSESTCVASLRVGITNDTTPNPGHSVTGILNVYPHRKFLRPAKMPSSYLSYPCPEAYHLLLAFPTCLPYRRLSPIPRQPLLSTVSTEHLLLQTAMSDFV